MPNFIVGEVVNISYTGYHIKAKILRFKERGWVEVEEQTGEELKPVYDAAEEFISHLGDPIKPPPFPIRIEAIKYE